MIISHRLHNLMYRRNVANTGLINVLDEVSLFPVVPPPVTKVLEYCLTPWIGRDRGNGLEKWVFSSLSAGDQSMSALRREKWTKLMCIVVECSIHRDFLKNFTSWWRWSLFIMSPLRRFHVRWKMGASWCWNVEKSCKFEDTNQRAEKNQCWQYWIC